MKLQSMWTKQAENYGRASAHKERQWRDQLGRSRGMPPPKNFENLTALRCILVHSGCLNLAKATIPYHKKKMKYLTKMRLFVIFYLFL